MTTLGGFLGLEQVGVGSGPYHDAHSLSTGRACLRFIVETVRPRRVHLPFYICDAVLAALRTAAVDHRFYSLDETLSPTPVPDGVAPGELYVVVNYFGLMGPQVAALGAGSRQRLVIDDSQAFFHHEPGGSWFFNSARKFFGVPDGAYLDGPSMGALPALVPAQPGLAHLFLRLVGQDQQAYREYRRHEDGLDSEPRPMSSFTARIMGEIDYAAVAAARRRNFLFLDGLLRHRNGLHLPLVDDEVPYCYPFLAPRPLREVLIDRGLFVPCLWAEVATRAGCGAFAWERELAARLCPLPVDQRYDVGAMQQVASRLLEVLGD